MSDTKEVLKLDVFRYFYKLNFCDKNRMPECGR